MRQEKPAERENISINEGKLKMVELEEILAYTISIPDGLFTGK